MATEADVLRSISAILESGERREQYKVQSALAMMQFAQQKRMSDIAETKSNLELAQKSLQQQKPIVASEFLSATRLGGIYQQTEEGETAEDAISEMVKTLRSKQYLGSKYDKNKANAIAGAVWNYYSAEDPTSIIRLGSNLYDASIAMEAGEQTPAQHGLFDAFMKLGVTADLKDISMAAKKARVSERRISKEISEFLQGDYEIQDPIGIYAGIPDAVEEADMDRRLKQKPASADYTEMETTREALRDAESRYKGLQNKMDANTATDDEKEEFYELPNLMDRFRSELGSSSDALQSSVQGDYEIQDPIGIYAGIPDAVEEADMDRRLKQKPASADYTEMETTRGALRDAESRYKGLQNKMDANTATDDEKEEFYELPNLMDRFRSELGSSSESLLASVQGELDDIDKQMKDMKDAGIDRSRQYAEVKRKRIEKRREALGLSRKAAEERQREVRSSEIENIAELLGVSTSEAVPYYEGAKGRELARNQMVFK